MAWGRRVGLKSALARYSESLRFARRQAPASEGPRSPGGSPAATGLVTLGLRLGLPRFRVEASGTLHEFARQPFEFVGHFLVADGTPDAPQFCGLRQVIVAVRGHTISGSLRGGPCPIPTRLAMI